jgi:AcrR family transcriptional regulator
MKTRARKATERASGNGDRERQIIDAATRIFQERGYDATTIQAIADEVGILKGSLYYYIETKEDLLFRISEEVHIGLAANLNSVDDAAEPLEQLRAFIANHVHFVADNLPAVRVFLHDFRALSEDRRKQIVKERDVYERRFRDLLTQAQDAGQIRNDLDLELVVLALFGMMNWMYQWYRPRGRKGPEEIARTFADVVLDGLRI